MVFVSFALIKTRLDGAEIRPVDKLELLTTVGEKVYAIEPRRGRLRSGGKCSQVEVGDGIKQE